jgi:predicted LPLAT superfamily acyltransferase
MTVGTGPAAAEWTRRPERGSPALVRFMVWLSLAIGRPASRPLVRLIALYFFLFSPTARRCSRVCLERCLGRAPTLSERFAVFFTFSSTIHDRLFFLKDRYDVFDVRVYGGELFAEGGHLLMGAHMGSFEAMRAAGHHHGHRRVSMAMYESNARLRAILGAINPDAMGDVVALGRLDSMLQLSARMDAGDLVGLLADRTFGEEPVHRVSFLGTPAPFPTGPMRMAAALRRKVYFMVGLYRGGNRYDLHFEELADFTSIEPGRRDAQVRAGIEKYAARLEHYCRIAPDNWFNFYDFWGRA